MNFYVTGDKHGQFQSILESGMVKDPNNAIIILGDAGINYYLNKQDDKLKDETIQEQIEWYIQPQIEGITINKNDTNGTAEIIVNENAKVGDKTTIVCKVLTDKEKENENEKYQVAEFNIEVVDEVKVDMSHKEIHYDLSNLPSKNKIIKATTNVINKNMEWKTSDENIAKTEEDLAKQYEAVIPYIEQNQLDKWIHNKTIQKAVESNRITAEQKNYLRTLRIK